MARAERHVAQGQIPVPQAQLVNAGNFPADTTSAQALKTGADVAGVFAELAIRRREAQDSLAATQASKARTQQELEMQQFMADNSDPDTWDKGFADISAKYGANYAGLKMTQQMRDKQDIEQQAANETLRMRVQLAATQQDIKNAQFESGANLIDIVANDDNGKIDAKEEIDALDRYKADLLRSMTPKMAEVQIEKTIMEGQEARAKNAIENIKPFLVDAIGESDKSEDGYRVLDAAIEQLVKDGVLTKPEGAEANKKLGDWIDNYVSGRIKAAKNADQLATMESYREFSKPILNGEMTYDDTGNFRQTRRPGEQESDQERWQKYLKGSYKDAPTKNKPEGLENSFDAVYGVTTLQVSPKEGYDILLQARFVDKSITNDQFEWAVEKIENPYSRYQLEDLNATMKSNRDDFDRDGFHRSLFPRVVPDQERNKRVNEALISWYDEQIENGKPPSKKEMEAKSASFRTGGAVPSDIGAVIPQGGWNWEIIGYDENGEPLVDNPTPIGGEIP